MTDQKYKPLGLAICFASAVVSCSAIYGMCQLIWWIVQ